MADFTFDGRTKVKTIKAQFKENFNATLRVYTTVDCTELADDEATLASIRTTGFAGGELKVKGNMKVATFERKMAELYGIGVQVANADNSEFADDTATLMGAASTASAESGSAHFAAENLEIKPKEYVSPDVEATEAELASARVKVYGKAQNRTALGIAHAYLIMYPHATLEDLCKAFPNAINPGLKQLFVDTASTDSIDQEQLKSSFILEDELLLTGDGKRVAFPYMWTKPNFEKLAAHAKQYGILVADFEKAPGGGKRGQFYLEYLNGYVPPMPVVQKKSKAGLWIAIAVIVVLLALLAVLLSRKPETQVVEVEKIVTVVDTVYVKQIEEIEKNFNAAEFVAGKADLSESAKFVLHDLAKMMQKHPELKLQLVGHTSAEGDAAFNQKLSEDRAQAAVDFMISHGGIEASRLEAIGKGSSELKNKENPMAPENRRTEFIVVE